MLSEIRKQLRPARSRLTMRRAAAALAGGLMLAGWVALVAGILTLFGGGTVAGGVGIALLILVPLLAIAVVYLRPASWQQAARAVDRRFRLQDRAATALYLAEHPSGDSLDDLQVEDALGRLRQLNTGDAVSMDIPWQRLLGGIALCLFAAGLIAWGLIAPPTAATAATMEPIDEDNTPRVVVDVIPMTPQLVRQSMGVVPGDNEENEFGLYMPNDSGMTERYFDAMQSSRMP